MKRFLTIGAAIAGGVAGTLATAAWLAHVQWNRATRRAAAALHQRQSNAVPRFSREDLAGLPDPVKRYFTFALTPGQSLVTNACVRQTGAFAMRPDAWLPFTAVEYFSVDPVGFLWDARISMAPLVTMYVHDGYTAGEGAMYGKLAALLPVVNQHGTPEMAAGELLRYLAEAVFLPTALLPRCGIAWEPLDDTNARATLTQNETTVSCDVRFGSRGEIVRIAALRYRDVDGKAVMTEWIGHWRDYRCINGMMIPMSGEVEWVLPEGAFTYWRGRMVAAHHEFAPSPDSAHSHIAAAS